METYICTSEAMKLCKVNSYEGFNAAKKKLGIEALWRGGKGNVYRKSDFEQQTIDRGFDPFYDEANG